MSNSLAVAVTQHLQRILQAPASHERLSQDLLRLATNYRLEVLRPRVQRAFGEVVAGGLFAGMRLLPRASEGCVLPKLLGCYEAALQPHLQELADTRPAVVLNVGCAEGWYAVGMARLLPTAVVHAFDIDPTARAFCAEMAALNGVAERVRIGNAFTSVDIAAFAGRKVLLLCDVEGAEQALLDPETSPALCDFDLVVEAHDAQAPISTTLAARFSATHEISVLDGRQRHLDLPPWFAALAEIDQLLAVWEMRRAPTPWLVMRRRASSDRPHVVVMT